MTDIGSAYRSRDFADLIKTVGLRHLRTRPYTPRTNGKAERFIQSSLREWAYATRAAENAPHRFHDHRMRLPKRAVADRPGALGRQHQIDWRRCGSRP